MIYLSNCKKVLQNFKCQIVDDNILFIKMLNEDYINSLTKYRYIKNQAKLIFNFLSLFILCFKKKIILKFNNNDGVVFLSLSLNNYL